MLPRVPQCFRAGRTPHQVDSNGRRRQVLETNGGAMSGDRNSSRSDSARYTRAKRCCGTGKPNDLRKNSRDPCRHGSAERTLGRAGMRCHTRQELKPTISTQGIDTLRSALWRMIRCVSFRCDRPENLCSHHEKENAKVGSSEFRRDYGRIWWIPSISNLDSQNKQDQGISGCTFYRRRNKEYGLSGSGRRYRAAY